MTHKIATERVYQVRLTEFEMQCIANACGAFYRMTNEQGWKVSAVQTAAIESAMRKFKAASEHKTIELLRS